MIKDKKLSEKQKKGKIIQCMVLVIGIVSVNAVAGP